MLKKKSNKMPVAIKEFKAVLAQDGSVDYAFTETKGTEKVEYKFKLAPGEVLMLRSLLEVLCCFWFVGTVKKNDHS